MTQSMEAKLNFDALMYMLKGEPAMRKSTQALSWPKPQYWFSFDQKMESLYLPMIKWQIKPSEVHYDNFTDWQKPLKKLEDLQLNCPYKCIVVDSITTMADAILRQTRKLKVGETRQSGKESGVRIAGIQVNELEDYKAESSAMGECISLLTGIKDYFKIPIVVIAHVIRQDQKSPNSTAIINRTIVTGAKKSASMFPALFTEVYHFESEGDMEADKPPKFYCNTMNTGDDFARTSLPLDRKITFNDRRLYDDYVKPAIEQQKEDVQKLIGQPK